MPGNAAIQQAQSNAVPPPAEESDIRVVGTSVQGPHGVVFGKLHKLGLFNAGQTSIDAFFAADGQAFPGVSASAKRVMRAVSQNEGKIEAINTWDNAILSCGIYQWTTGAGSNAGELAGLLEVLQQRAPASFETYFGSLGLGFVMNAGPPGALRRGFLTLGGNKLDNGAAKSVLRKPLWAYRFWRAAHDAEMRRAQIALAISRLEAFYRVAIPGKAGHSAASYISSEYGVALLLDQHVNRPDHVPATLVTAIDGFIAKTKKKDPAKWTSGDESRVLAGYLTERNATSMTDSQNRADRTRAHVGAGRLSDKRGSFVL